MPIVEDRREAVRQAAGQYYRLRIWHQRRRGLDPETAVEVVQEGTIRALTTQALPDLPSAAWLKAVDDSARLDMYRSQGRARAAAGAMAAYEIQVDKARLPARGAGISVEVDPDDVAFGDGAAERGPEQIRLTGDQDGVRYLPAPAPHVHVPQPDETYDRSLGNRKHRIALAREASQQLEALAARSDVDLALLRARYGALRPVPWEQVAKALGTRKEQVRRRAQADLAALREAAGADVDVVTLIQRTYILTTTNGVDPRHDDD